MSPRAPVVRILSSVNKKGVIMPSVAYVNSLYHEMNVFNDYLGFAFNFYSYCYIKKVGRQARWFVSMVENSAKDTDLNVRVFSVLSSFV